MHPYEISTTLRTRGKEHSIKLNYGSLYSVVESLQKHGLITSRETTREGRRPERTVYEITAAGVGRVRGLAGRADLHPGARLHLARGRPVAHARVCRRTRWRACSRTARSRCASRSAGSTRPSRSPPRSGCPRSSRSRATCRHGRCCAPSSTSSPTSPSGSAPARLGGTSAWRRLHELRAAGMSFEADHGRPGRPSRERRRRLLAADSANDRRTPDRCANTGQGPNTPSRDRTARPEAHSSR